MIKKGDKKLIRGWVFYDWANSVYNLVISSAVFPIFYDNITTNRYLKEKGWDSMPEGQDVMVSFFGMETSNSSLIAYVLSASFLVVSILSPMLSGVADFTGNKKRFLQFFAYLGALSCITLYWFDKAPIELGMLSVFFASIGFWNSLVFYNAYLPEIADPDQHDLISARGFSMGYFGSMIALILCLALIMFTGEKGSNTKWSFILVGLWWLGFSQVTYRVIPNKVDDKKRESGMIWKGFRELKLVFSQFKQTYRLKRFLRAFFFYNSGVQTVMLMSVIFAKKEVDWSDNGGDTGLIIAILLIQILGATGAFLMSRISGKIGNIKTLGVSVIIWIAICFVAYVVRKPAQFYLLAATVGLVMGGVQALSRSTYSKFLPDTKNHTSFFSFYDVIEKVGIVIGTFAFGFMDAYLGSIRYSVISVAAFFILGLVFLFFVPKNERILNSSD